MGASLEFKSLQPVLVNKRERGSVKLAARQVSLRDTAQQRTRTVVKMDTQVTASISPGACLESCTVPFLWVGAREWNAGAHACRDVAERETAYECPLPR